MNRAEAREFAEAWVLDSKTLLDAGRWHAAYYLAGYAVESALKACVLGYVEKTGIIFQDKKYAEKCFTHDIELLVSAADLQTTRGLAIRANPGLGLNWQIVKDWSVDARYQAKTEPEARQLYDAVTDHANGVLPWIKAHW